MGALIDERTRSRLGESLNEVLASLWPGDCQSCGTSLGSDPPALVVDELDELTRASLHHARCRAPGWHDGWVMIRSDQTLTTQSIQPLLLPVQIVGKGHRVAGLLVNPSLEEVLLGRESGSWRPRPEERFRFAGLTPRAADVPLGRAAPGVSGRTSETSLTAVIDGLNQTFEARAQSEIRASVDRRGGFLLIVTHAIDPAHLSLEAFYRALGSSLTLIGWAALESGQGA